MDIAYVKFPGIFPSTINDLAYFLLMDEFQSDSISVHDLNIEIWKDLYEYKIYNQYKKETEGPLAKLFSKKKQVKESNIFTSLQDGEVLDRDLKKQDYLELSERINHINNAEKLDISFSRFFFKDLNINDETQFLKEIHKLKQTYIGYFFNKIIEDKKLISKGLILFEVKFNEEFFISLIFAQILKDKGYKGHICIANHFYENFSLNMKFFNFPNEWVYQYIDSIVVNCNRTPQTIMALRDSLEKNHSLGLLSNLRTFENNEAASSKGPNYHKLPASIYHRAQAIHTPLPFQTKDVMKLRLSSSFCSYKKCTFCVQNEKLHSDEADTYFGLHEDIEALVSKFEILSSQGISNFIVTDEYLEPGIIKKVSQKIIDKGLKVTWAGRTNFTKQLENENLLELMRKSGCVEMLVGFESIHSKTLASMDKPQKHMNTDEMTNIIDKMVQHKVGIHLSMIYGYPTECAKDFMSSLLYASEKVNSSLLVTTTMNIFSLFGETVLFNNSNEYGLKVINKDKKNLNNIYEWAPMKGFFKLPNDLFKESLDSVVRNLTQDQTSKSKDLNFFWSVIQNSGVGILIKGEYVSNFQ